MYHTHWRCFGGVVEKHKEIKIDDDCNMMMVHCIKIQKFFALQPKWNSANIFGAHVCGKRTNERVSSEYMHEYADNMNASFEFLFG